jgi:nitrate reductase assembly molybdenum cofactor insertion protein NarJ
MQHYRDLAALFTYPDKRVLKGALRKLRGLLPARYPLLPGGLDGFEAFVDSRSDDELREHYLKTFDIQPSCYLDVGYVLFGEDYKRGAFLVNMAEEHKKAGHDCGLELPDHLPNMLRLLPMMSDPDMAEQLAYCLMIPALREMLRNFLDADNAYKQALALLADVMEADFAGSKYEQVAVVKKEDPSFVRSNHLGPRPPIGGSLPIRKECRE